MRVWWMPIAIPPRKLPGVVGWVKLAGRSFVAAALVGAAQLGVAQALALLVWSTVPTPDVWRRHLTWMVFIFAAAVLGGVAGGRRSVREIRRAIANSRADAAAARHAGLVAHRSGLRAARRRAVAAARSKTVDTARGVAAMATRVSATVFAALGAAASFALVWLPARNAFAPADMRVLAISAGVGIVVGAVLALLCLAAAPIAANVGVSLAGLWLFGLASVGIAIATDQPTITPRLGVLDAPPMIGPDEWWLGPHLVVVMAAVFGVAVAGTARWLSAHRLAIALSGLAGPSVVAAAYLVVGPAGDLMSSYVAALLAATVGLLTSAATAATHRGTVGEPTTARTPAALTAGVATAPPRRPLAIESGRAAQRPAARKPAGRKPAAQTAAAQTAAAQTAAAQTAAAHSPAGLYPAADPLYLAPPRSAPVPPARVSPPVPPQRSMPPATAGAIRTAYPDEADGPGAGRTSRSATARATPPPAPPAPPRLRWHRRPLPLPPAAPGRSLFRHAGREQAVSEAGGEQPTRPTAPKKPVAEKPSRRKTAAKQAQEKPGQEKPGQEKPGQDKPAGATTPAAKPAGRASRRGRFGSYDDAGPGRARGAPTRVPRFSPAPHARPRWSRSRHCRRAAWLAGAPRSWPRSGPPPRSG